MQLKKGQRFFKRIAGVAGDRVSVEDRRVLINGADVGIARAGRWTAIAWSRFRPA